MEFVRVEAYSRADTGKGAARKFRAAGQVPGVVYGAGREPQPIVVARETLERIARLGTNVVLELCVDGQSPPEGVAAMVKAVEHHPVTRAPLSVDFQWVSLTRVVHVSVPVVLTGSPEGVRLEGGVLEQLLHDVEIRCLPTNIPPELTVDVTHLKVHESVHVRDLALPEGVEIVTDPDAAVATIVPPRIQVEEAAPGAAEEVAEQLEEARPGVSSAGQGQEE
ncbi:MAG: 50S ribosomal protein L25 [Armatimonadetes bacterium]|nr:50S ribosomal protein L25 [Armatimonadota bacterium]